MDPQVFIDIEPSQMRTKVQQYSGRGWRFVNICGSTVSEGVELIYSFSDYASLENLRFVVQNGTHLPSISDLYLSSFFFENETHDLFGVVFDGIAIDFGGTFYAVSVPTPMNPMSSQAKEAWESGSYGAADSGACVVPESMEDDDAAEGATSMEPVATESEA